MHRLLLLAITATATLAAQAPPQFRSRVDLVHLDVSVLDQNRRPVKGLTAADFTVLEDGQPQPITAFDAIDLPDPPAPTTTWMRDVAPDVRRNTEIAERRLVAIVMDNATIPFHLPMIKSAREIGRLVVDKLGPNDLATVVFTRDNRAAQEFTSDRARLLRAVDSFDFVNRNVGIPINIKPPPPGLVAAEFPSFEASVGALARVAESLAEVPQRRKAVIFVSVGVPAGSASLLALGAVGVDREISAMNDRIRYLMERTFQRARLANVNIYAVSPAGVGGMAQYIDAERWKGNYVPPYETPANYLDFLMAVADNTGGRAFPERNEFESALAQVFLENGSYYLLGYTAPNAASDGRFRRVEVKVNRPGLSVRTRNGYYNDRPAEAKAASDLPAVTAALAGLLPRTDVGLEATAAAFGIPGRPDAGVVVVLTVHQEASERKTRTNEAVDMQIAAFTQEGSPRGSSRYETTVTLRPGPAGHVTYEVLSALVLRPGRYQLRLSAHVGAQQKTGSVYYDIDVPDFQGSNLTLSGILLESDDRPVSSDTSRIRAYVPVAPTAKRTFAVTERVNAFARIYQGGRDALSPVNLSITITDDRGAIAVQRATTVPRAAVGTADRSADFSMEIPVKTLPPGEYLLALDAMSGRGTARRSVRFAVR